MVIDQSCPHRWGSWSHRFQGRTVVVRDVVGGCAFVGLPVGYLLAAGLLGGVRLLEGPPVGDLGEGALCAGDAVGSFLG